MTTFIPCRRVCKCCGGTVPAGRDFDDQYCLACKPAEQDEED